MCQFVTGSLLKRDKQASETMSKPTSSQRFQKVILVILVLGLFEGYFSHIDEYVKPSATAIVTKPSETPNSTSGTPTTITPTTITPSTTTSTTAESTTIPAPPPPPIVTKPSETPNSTSGTPTTIIPSTTTSTTTSTTAERTTIPAPQPPPVHGICQRLKDGNIAHRSAASLWTEYTEQIFEASIHPVDAKLRHHAEWTKALLDFASPIAVLQKSIKTPVHKLAWRRIMDKILSKLEDDSQPPVRIAIFGGSVPQGSGCNVVDGLPQIDPFLQSHPKGERPNIQGNACSWPYRLELLLNTMFHVAKQHMSPANNFTAATKKQELVKVYNLAVGGTSTILSGPVINYWLYPDGTPFKTTPPDIIVNSYAANDNLPSTPNITGTLDYTRSKYNVLWKHLKSIEDSVPCQSRPLVLFYDEYLGNQHGIVVGEGLYHEAVRTVAEAFPFALISSADAIKPYFYANVHETLFSAKFVWKGQPHVDVHAGMPVYLLGAWTMAYSALQSTMEFCQDQAARLTENVDAANGNSKLAALKKLARMDPEKLGNPPMAMTSTFASLSKQWHESHESRTKYENQICNSGYARTSPCSFAFVANPVGTHNTPPTLNAYIQKHLASPFAPNVPRNQLFTWSAERNMGQGWGNKIGFVPSTPDGKAPIALWIPTNANTIRTVHINYLRSYGPPWDGSRARFDIAIFDQNQTIHHQDHFELDAYHQLQNSIQYPHSFDLGEEHKALPNMFVRLTISMVTGTKMKIHALMLCSK